MGDINDSTSSVQKSKALREHLAYCRMSYFNPSSYKTICWKVLAGLQNTQLIKQKYVYFAVYCLTLVKGGLHAYSFSI